MLIVEFDPIAIDDISQAALFYDERVPGLGNEFSEEITKAINRIKKFPAAFPIVTGPYHRIFLNRFPFGIIYRFDEKRLS